MSAQNIREILGELFYLISFPSVDFEVFVKCLNEDKLYTNDEIGKIFFDGKIKEKEIHLLIIRVCTDRILLKYYLKKNVSPCAFLLIEIHEEV